MRVGLIGNTGFVGTTISRILPEVYGYNSRNVSKAIEQNFDIVYCAAAPGSMFLANKDGQRDADRITNLVSSLRKIKTKRFVLISTIAVFDRFDGGCTEDGSAFQQSVPYGLNRRKLEIECQSIFENCLIVRLPALFAKGLAKNFIFDLLNPTPTMLNETSYNALHQGLPRSLLYVLEKAFSFDQGLSMHVLDRNLLATLADKSIFEVEMKMLGVNAVNFHNKESTYQFYDLSRIVDDISIASDAGLEIVHLAPAPLRVADIFSSLTDALMPANNAKLHRENMHTKHAELWNKTGPYNFDGNEVMAGLKAFYDSEVRI